MTRFIGSVVDGIAQAFSREHADSEEIDDLAKDKPDGAGRSGQAAKIAQTPREHKVRLGSRSTSRDARRGLDVFDGGVGCRTERRALVHSGTRCHITIKGYMVLTTCCSPHDIAAGGTSWRL